MPYYPRQRLQRYPISLYLSNLDKDIQLDYTKATMNQGDTVSSRHHPCYPLSSTITFWFVLYNAEGVTYRKEVGYTWQDIFLGKLPET